MKAAINGEENGGVASKKAAKVIEMWRNTKEEASSSMKIINGNIISYKSASAESF